MKIKIFSLFTLAFTASLALATVVRAHRGGHDAMPPTQPNAPSALTVQLPTKMVDTLAAIHGQFTQLKAALADGKFSAVSSNALTLNQLVQHIVTQVSADQQGDVKVIADRQAKLTAELSRAAAAGADKAVSAIIAQLSTNLRALQLLEH